MMYLTMVVVALAQETSLEAENSALREALEARSEEALLLRDEARELRAALLHKDEQIAALAAQIDLKDEYIASVTRQLEAEREYSALLEVRTTTIPAWAKAATGILAGVATGYIMHDIATEVNR